MEFRLFLVWFLVLIIYILSNAQTGKARVQEYQDLRSVVRITQEEAKASYERKQAEIEAEKQREIPKVEYPTIQTTPSDQTQEKTPSTELQGESIHQIK